jgi:hypothetical protein
LRQDDHEPSDFKVNMGNIRELDYKNKKRKRKEEGKEKKTFSCKEIICKMLW